MTALIAAAKAKKKHWELDEQKKVVALLSDLKMKGVVAEFSAVASETFTTSHNQKRLNRLKGVRKGVPDLIIVFANGNILFLEMKRARLKGAAKGALSAEQKGWITALKMSELVTGGRVSVSVAHGFEEAVNVIHEASKKGDGN